MVPGLGDHGNYTWRITGLGFPLGKIFFTENFYFSFLRGIKFGTSRVYTGPGATSQELKKSQTPGPVHFC